MVLQNYWAWRRYSQDNYNNTYTSATGIVDINGVSISKLYGASGSGAAQTNMINKVLSIGSSNMTYLRLSFGSGDTEPDALDYNLASDVTSNILMSGTNNFNYETNKLEIIFLYQLSNNGGTDIVIKEVGIVKRLLTTSITDYADVLIVRELLEEPITIPAGETKTINYVWTMQ